ncbi:MULTISPECIES: hypothetical protein [Vibrio]|uniref:hypothetical protein n=1 Tax=Vibrio TaxID=662 RepID=UPI000C824E27|nr:hypothetical protein [Vibrio kanaloae]PMM05706.1 hypothetical protein BCT63_09205 [Vibrio kanaloae]
MKVWDSIGLVVYVLGSLVSMAFGGAFFFLIWGVFNGFDWDLQLFLSKAGLTIAIILAIGCAVHFFVIKPLDSRRGN